MSGVPLAFSVSKISCEFSLTVRLIATSCKPAGQHAGQRLGTLGRSVDVRVQPLAHRAREVLMRADYSRRRVTERLMVDGRLGVHHLVERSAVLVAVAELEPRLRPRGRRCPRCV